MATPTLTEHADALASLEERILRAVELLTELRTEKEAAEERAGVAISERDEAVASLRELKAENAKMTEELESLRAERKEVRGRIEKLLGQMDLLAT
jgi:chromosome segregation ATPase